MDLKTTITVNSQAKLDAIQKTTQELNRASVATQLLTKAQQLLGKQLGVVNTFTEDFVMELQDVADMASAIPDLLKDIGSEQERVNNLWQSFVSSDTLPTFTEFNETAKELASNINATSKATGIAINDMSKLATFASKNGLEFDTLNDLLVTLAQNLGEVSRGEGDDIVKALKALGISAKDAKGNVREAMPVFLDISQAFDKYQDGVTKAALAGKFFDEEGTKYIGAISKVHKQFNELNPILGQEFVAIVQRAGQSTKDLNLAFSQLGAEIGSRLLPITTAITDTITRLINLLLKIPKPIKDLIFGVSLVVGSLGALGLIVKSATLVFFAFNVVLKSAKLGFTAFGIAANLIKGLLPTAAVGVLSKVFTGLLAALKLVAAAILKNPFALLITSLLGINPLAISFVANIGKIGSALALLSNPITALIGGIAAIGGALYLSNKDFREWVNGIGRMIGDNLYTFIVGASSLFKQFAAEVGTQLARVGQGLADFFNNRIFPVLTGVISGLITMFNGFFKWVFDAFNAVAEKVIGLYNVLPEQVRNLLGQIGTFSKNIIENMPIFVQARALMDFVDRAMRRGRDVRRGRAFEADTSAQTRQIEKPDIPLVQEKKPDGPKPGTKPTTTDTRAKEAQDLKRRQEQVEKIDQDYLSKLKDIGESLTKIFKELGNEIIQLESDIEEALVPLKSFNKSTNIFLDQISKGIIKLPTMAENISKKYQDIFNKFNIETTKISAEINAKLLEITNESEQKMSDVLKEFDTKLKEIVPNILTNPVDRDKLGKQNFSEQVDYNINLLEPLIPDQLKQIEQLKQALELIKSITPELQKDMEAILAPQQEQLKTSQENQSVLENTIKFLRTGLNPEQAKTAALAEAEKKEREQSLNALKALRQVSKDALTKATEIGDQDSITALQDNLSVLDKYIDQWSNINKLIDDSRNKTKQLEKQAEQLAEVQERNKQIAQGVAQAIGDGLGDVFDLLFTKTENWGQALLDISANILKQIAQQLFQIMVIAPIVNALTGGIGRLIGVKFATGGIMTDRGPVPLKKYASGGIATSPQLAIFGEGRKPEAYVPLPDGRRIPVAMQSGGGGNVSVNVSVDASGSQVSGSPSQGDQLGRAIANAVQLEIVKQQRPGGLLYV